MKQNRSYTYLLPLLFSGASIPPRYKAILKNMYIFNGVGKSTRGILYLETVSKDDVNIPPFVEALKATDTLIQTRESIDSIIYKVKLSDDFVNEYDAYLTGKYSHFCEEAKEIILSFWTDYLSDSYASRNFVVKVKQILYKDAALRKQLDIV